MEECYFNRNNTPPRYVTRFVQMVQNRAKRII